VPSKMVSPEHLAGLQQKIKNKSKRKGYFLAVE
jgi:hypothetical protein